MSDTMLGKVFATCGAEEQAEFLNTAGRTLRRVCEDAQAMDTQCCWIVDKLDGNGRDLVKRIASFIAHDEETPHVVHRVVYQDEIVPRPVEAEGVEP
jgi:hypothetical protein